MFRRHTGATIRFHGMQPRPASGESTRDKMVATRMSRFSLRSSGRLLLPFMLAAASRVSFAERAAATPAPQVLSLLPIGYKPVVSPMLLREGFSTVTVDFVDSSHVLVTFAERKLVPRLPGHEVNHPDRLIKAVVLHLPDGKVERETEWRAHDMGRYVWKLRGDQFLVRTENTLHVMNALRDGPQEDRLERKTLMQMPGTVESVQVSPSGDLLLVEFSAAKHTGDDPHAPAPEFPVAAAFYALEDTPGKPGEVQLRQRGLAKSHNLFSMAFTSFGILETIREDRQHWGFDFHPFAGGVDTLAGFTSTCKPESYFVSEGEFFAAGCRGGDDRRLLAGFNLLAEPSWVFTTNDPPAWLAFQAAPAAGRFALRNTLLRSAMADPDHIGTDDVRTQEISVYNVRDGVELLKVPCAPAMRAGQNFALSPDGLRLAALEGSDLKLYTLPPPSKEDMRKLEQSVAAVHKHDGSRGLPIDQILRQKP